jgi:hypothetical protein
LPFEVLGGLSTAWKLQQLVYEEKKFHVYLFRQEITEPLGHELRVPGPMGLLAKNYHHGQ